MGEGIARRLAGRDHARLHGPALGPARSRSRRRTPSCCARASPRSSCSRVEYAKCVADDAWARRASTPACAAWTPSSARCGTSIPQPGGRFLNALDIAEKRRVVFLGRGAGAATSSGPRTWSGKTVQINQSTFLVVGVAQKKIQMGMYNGPDKNQATIPGPTFKSMYTDAKIENLVYRPVSLELGGHGQGAGLPGDGRQVPLRPRGHARRSGSGTPARTSASPTTSRLGIQIFLGIIGALTLFVGGMGVANIMYAVVKERTREIGVKMALGAKERQVMLPFVLEALLMTVLGGILGHRGLARPDRDHRRPAPEGRGLRVHGPAHLLARDRRRHRAGAGHDRQPGRLLPRASAPPRSTPRSR